MGSSIFTGSGIKIYSNFGIRDKKIRSKNGISLKKIYLATTLPLDNQDCSVRQESHNAAHHELIAQHGEQFRTSWRPRMRNALLFGLSFQNAVNKITKKCMRICLTLLKIVL